MHKASGSGDEERSCVTGKLLQDSETSESSPGWIIDAYPKGTGKQGEDILKYERLGFIRPPPQYDRLAVREEGGRQLTKSSSRSGMDPEGMVPTTFPPCNTP